jgi:hypothetical protein
MKRRYIVASTGTLLLQEYWPIACAWKTVIFLKGGGREAEAKAWVEENVAEKLYEIIDIRTGKVVATADSPEAARIKRQGFTRALIKVDAGKGFFQIRIS